MAVSAPDPGLERSRIRPAGEHALIVIAFKHQAITRCQHRFDMLGRASQIGKDTQSYDTIGKNKLRRLPCIMRDGERRDLKVTDGKTRMMIDQPDPRSILRAGLRRHRTGSRQRAVRHPQRNLVLARQARGAADVIPMLMGNDDGVDFRWHDPEPFQPALDLANAETAIKQDAGDRPAGMRFDNQGITFATRTERGETQPTYHRRLLQLLVKKTQDALRSGAVLRCPGLGQHSHLSRRLHIAHLYLVLLG